MSEGIGAANTISQNEQSARIQSEKTALWYRNGATIFIELLPQTGQEIIKKYLFGNTKFLCDKDKKN